MKKHMRKPIYWTDFEDLCKKTWGSKYNFEDIKKNGRQGQAQHGVDVYGRLDSLDGYFGIQCKGKDAYNPDASLTIKEIDEEIEKSKTFKPPLKKFIFATTANKDVKIEEYIRLKDEESRKLGFFPIVLFSWEDLVDLIEEDKYVYDWYVNDILHSSSYSIKVKVNDNLCDKVNPYILRPKYIKETINHVCRMDALNSSNVLKDLHFPNIKFPNTSLNIAESIIYATSGREMKQNFQVFEIQFSNEGSGSFSNCNYGVIIDEEDNLDIYYSVYSGGLSFGDRTKRYSDKFEILNTGILKSKELYFEFPETYNDMDDILSEFIMHWYFTSKEHTKMSEGELYFKVQPEITETYKTLNDAKLHEEYTSILYKAEKFESEE
ncbi:MAG: hypothetical protein KQ78_00213 [Candidatus Izimaplasma bacterium HR2]|nr:MAG: hypothetical protein KQ78_00213 [Candidatus Izimaplasma bacterium HR2]